MQTTTEANKQTHEQTDRNEHRHTFSLILLSEHSLSRVSSVQKHVYLWFILMVTSVVYVCANKNEVINYTILTLQLKSGVWGTRTPMQQQIVVTVVESSSFTSYKEQGDEHVYGALQPSHMQLDNYFHQTHGNKHTPHLMTPSFQRNGAILDCMLWTGICKLSKLQMIACSFLAYHYRERNQVNNSPILSMRQNLLMATLLLVSLIVGNKSVGGGGGIAARMSLSLFIYCCLQ